MIRTHWMIACALMVLAIGFTAAVYPSLPERIPIHWNAHGEIDGWGSKPWSFLTPAIMVFMLGLLRVIPWLSPKQFEVDTFRGTYAFIVMLVMGLLAYIHVLTLLPPLGYEIRTDKALLGGMMLFFMLRGNVLGKVQRNFFVGVRTPWTLASERVWIETHRLAARVFVGTGAGIRGGPAGIVDFRAPGAAVRGRHRDHPVFAGALQTARAPRPVVKCQNRRQDRQGDCELEDNKETSGKSLHRVRSRPSQVVTVCRRAGSLVKKEPRPTGGGIICA